MTPRRVALALMLVAPLAHAAEVCQLDPAAAPDKIEYVIAFVVGPTGDAEALAQTRVEILRAKSPVSRAYVNLPRIDAIFRNAKGSPDGMIAAMLSGLSPPRRAHVTLASWHRDPNQACAFAHWTAAKPARGLESSGDFGNEVFHGLLAIETQRRAGHSFQPREMLGK